MSQNFESETTLEELFPMKQHKLETSTKIPILVITTGDAIANQILAANDLAWKTLQVLHSYLRDCKENDNAHGLSFEMCQSLVDRQEEMSALVDQCVDLTNEMNGIQ